MWYTYCAQNWSDSAFTVVCRAMGYSEVVNWSMMDVNQVSNLNKVVKYLFYLLTYLQLDVIGNTDCSSVFLTCSVRKT